MIGKKKQGNKSTKAQKSEPIVVAQIMGKWLGGGVESVIMNYYRHIDRNKIQFDFICDEDSTNIPYDEIKNLGGHVILCPPYQKLPKYLKFLKQLFREKKYRIVHSNINTLSVFPLYVAKKAGVPVRIAHSHSTSNPREWKKNLMKNALRPFSKVWATDYFACTKHAGEYQFGKKAVEQGKVKIITNAIDIEKFKFDPEARRRLRKEFGFSDEDFVVGNIGRMIPQKNQLFLLDAFYELKKENPNAKLLIIGDGDLRAKIDEKVEKLGLQKGVHIEKYRKDVNKCYSAMDLFAFPSIYEGLGMVAVEAQMSGLAVVASKKVPVVAKVSDDMCFISEYKTKEWASAFMDNIIIHKRKSIFVDFYDIAKVAKDLEACYVDERTIELYGLPGSGKTTLCFERYKSRGNLNAYLSEGGRIKRNIRRLILSMKFRLSKKSENDKIRQMLGLFMFSSSIKRMKMKYYLLSILQMINQNKNSKYVMDEGVCQALWAFCYNSKYTEESIVNYIRTLRDYFPEKIIHLNTGNKAIEERLVARNRSGGSELEHDITHDKSALIRARRIEEEIIKAISIYTESNLEVL